VKGRQAVHGDGMRAGDGQFAVAVVMQATAQQPRVHTQIISPQAAFDGDLPQTGGAED
jgi:hypothetical protein